MTTIREKLDHDLKEAMRAKDTLRLETIRSIRGAIRSREIDSGSELDEAAILALIRSLVKQREDSIEQYAQGGRNDLVEKEQTEKEILAAYLPAAPSKEQLQKTVDAAIAEVGATSMKEMGKVMALCKQQLGPAVDGKELSALVKQRLS